MTRHRPHIRLSQTWRDRFRALGYIPPLLRMVWETSPSLASSIVVLRLVSSVLPVIHLWLGKLLIDQIVHPRPDRSVWVYLGMEILATVASDALKRTLALTDSLIGDRFTNHVNIRMMTHASRLDLASFEDADFHDKMDRARRQSGPRLGMIATLAGMCQQFVTLLSLSSTILLFAPWLLPLLVTAVFPVFLGETRFAMLAYSLMYRFTPERREIDYFSMLGTSGQSAKEAKIFGLAPYLIERVRNLFERFYLENKKVAIKRTTAGFLLTLIPTGAYYSAYALIIYRTASGTLTLGDLVLLAGAFAQSRGLIEGLLLSLSSVVTQAVNVKDLFDFFDTQATVRSDLSAIPAPRPIRNGIEFRNVSFSYPGAASLALRNVSFRLDRGEKLALVGENGAGKTTVVKLLARLYDPLSGTVLIDGIDIREYEIEDLHREIGIVFQDYMRYDMTVCENIGLGRIEEMGNETRIKHAARKSLADSTIAQMPGGFQQMLGKRFETGIDLSAGQWQKIALARAYMRDAQILILDEPAASLDARAESEMSRRFAELTNDKMAILISHRFSTVRLADRILVLEGGTVREEGTHDQLVTLSGRYAELFDLQAQSYR